MRNLEVLVEESVFVRLKKYEEFKFLINLTVLFESTRRKTRRSSESRLFCELWKNHPEAG